MSEPDSTARADPATVYARRSELHGVAERQLADRSRTISYVRVATFLGAAACLVAAFGAAGARGTWLYGAGAGLVVAFVALVAYHSRVEERARRYRALRRINDLALAKLRREWARVTAPSATAPPLHAYADDLDLFGHASLFTLLWNGGTDMGRRRLADWLLAPAGPDAVRNRQRAIDELAGCLDLRQEMLAAAETGSLESHQTPRFLEWAEGGPWLSARPVALWGIRALTGAIAVLVALQVLGVVRASYWVLPALLAFVISNLSALKIEHVFECAFAQQHVFRYYAQLFHLVSSADLHAPLLRQIQETLLVAGQTAEYQMKRLQRLMALADLRHSALVHLPVQILTLWDFHIVAAVERWQRRSGRHARAWLDALGSFEALAALATLRFDEAAWAFPRIENDGGCVVDATGLGHPLLAAGVRVDNDVRVGPPGTFLLVTGSNMSGKSTLLRAIGLNVVLAQAGAPVCAANMRLPPVRLHTSMRVQDSLEEGVSFFMAAVKRLKQVVAAAGPVSGAAGDPCASTRGGGGSEVPVLLYLLDEVLQGTNTAERQIAVRSVLRHLLARSAIGAVTTHDLTLADAQDLAAAAQSVHFTEHLQPSETGAVMTFDYRLRPGLATSRNALRLMQMVGLDVNEP